MPSYKYETKSGHVRWFCSFYARSYDGKNRKVKKSGFATKRDADAWERDYLATSNGLAAEMTIRQVAAAYTQDLSSRRKPITAARISTAINNHILPVFGDRPIATLTAADVRAWENELISSSMLAPATIRYVVGRLAAICNFAVRLYGLASNPVHAAGPLQLSPSSPSATPHALRFWTLPQFQSFITSELPPQYITLFCLLFWTGCRVGEALALTLRDYDREAQTLRIDKTVSVVSASRKYIQPPKTVASVRTIALPSFLCDILDDWIRSTDMQNPGDMFFLFSYNTPIEIFLHKRAATCGLPTIRVHDLRHSHASLLVHLGFPPIVIRDRLGHRDIQTTLNIYAHLYPSKQDDLRHALEGAR